MSIKKNISAPLSSGLGATRRAAMLLLVMMFTATTAWANDPWWLRDGDSWDETTKTLTVNTPEVVENAYRHRSEIEYVIFSNSVTIIRRDAFNDCSNLKTVFVGSSVASIDVGAFGSYPNLKSIIITRTASAPWIYHDSAFPDNAKIYVPADEYGNVLQIYRQADGWWQLNSDKRLFPSWSSGTHAAALNEGVLTVVGIGDLTSYVGPSFKDVVLSAVIGDGVTSIGEQAFLGCVNMTSVSIPASVTSINNAAFLANQELGAITVAAGNQTYDSRNNCNAIIRKADNTLMIGCKGTVIPDGVTSIANNAFYICSGLTDISIPNSVTSIGATAFWGCTSLQSVAIGSGLASIDPSAFNSCHNLTTITVDENNQTFDSHGNCNAIIRKSDNTLVAGCKGTIIPNSVTSIGEKAFGYNDGLISIAIPNTVKSIGNQAFMNCSALESVAIYATSVPAQGTQAFFGNKNGRKFYVLSDVVNAYKTAWSEFANDIKAIEANGICSKDNSENLKWVLTGDAPNRILAIFGTGDMKDYSSASDRPWNSYAGDIRTVLVSSGVTSIGDYAFTSTGLTSFEIPATVTSIGYVAFGYCNNLTSITIPATVTSISASVFNGCDNLANIYVPAKNVASYKSAWSSFDYKDNISVVFDGTSLEALSFPDNVTVNGVKYDRTFTVGKPSTVMLPFSKSVSDISGGTFFTFGGVQKEYDTWVATMNQVTGTIEANTPYLFVPTGHSLTFTGGATLNTTGGGGKETADAGSHWTFKGTYDYKEWIADGANADEIGRAYGFAGVAKDGINVGDFVKVASGAKIRPMGCYLLWNDEPNSAPRHRAAEELPSRITVRLVGAADGGVTGIGTLDTKTGGMTFDSEAWYTLDGVRLNGKPSKEGLYINDGKKIVIK